MQLTVRRPLRLSLPAYDWDRIGLLAALVVGTVYGLAIAFERVDAVLDFRFYWRATDFTNLYPANWLDPDYAYVYPPVLAQALAPFHVLPYELVATGWLVLCFACTWYCLRAWTLPVFLVGLVGLAVGNGILALGLGVAMMGNVTTPIAAAIVFGMRHPGAFAVPVLTKLTTGVGALWFAFRGEWRRFGLAVAVTAAIVAVSFVLSPGAWAEYVAFSVANYGGPSNPPIIGPPLPVRIVGAVLLLALAARTNRAWLVPLACAIATPALYGWGTIIGIGLGSVSLRHRHAQVPGERAGALDGDRVRDDQPARRSRRGASPSGSW